MAVLLRITYDGRSEAVAIGSGVKSPSAIPPVVLPRGMRTPLTAHRSS